MKFLQTPFQYFLLILFVLYLILPIETPFILSNLLNSPLGMIILFLITIALFVYVNPILGILYIFVAYEILRRSNQVSGKSAYITYTPTQTKKDDQMQKMNPPKEITLEETIIEKMSPIGKSEPLEYINTTFKPVSDKIHGASEV